LDLGLPDINGYEVWDQLNAMSHPPHVLLLTCRTDDALLYRISYSGAGGLIWKCVDFAAHLRRALTVVAAGGCYFPSDVGEAIRKFRCSPDAFFKILSPWEQRLVSLLARGLKDNEIAVATGLRRGTIRNHWANLARKLGLSDRHDLTRWAEVKGFGSEPRPIIPVRPEK
jgi:DNA-binding NarL/FixJ family response regulator